MQLIHGDCLELLQIYTNTREKVKNDQVTETVPVLWFCAENRRTKRQHQVEL